MSIRQPVLAAMIAASLLVASQASHGQGIIVPTTDGKRVSWPVAAESAHQLRLVAPDGSVSVHDFPAGQTVALEQSWQEGRYRFELIELPTLSANQIATAKAARERGDMAGDTVNTVSHNGGFLIDADGNGPSGKEVEAAVHDHDEGSFVPRSTRDQVIPESLIVQNSLCVGFDCVNPESYGFDTIRLKENNTRIAFRDTSVGTFPARQWEITANDSASGGLDYLGFTDIGTGARPFWVQAGSRNNALVVVGNRIGFGTSAPMLDTHHVSGDTPGTRLEQTTAGGFSAQTWDIAGNEAGFFVRDVTNGSMLPLRIRPGAPTSTLDLAGNGDVGVGTASPTAKLDIHRAAGDQPLLRARTGFGASEVTQMQLEANGNLRVNGTLSQLSSRAAKTGFVDIDPGAVLDAVASLPISFWSYLHQDSGIRHVGPTAEDFHAAFGLGERPTEIATGDMAGVALAAIQALNQEVADRDRRIEDLEERLRRLEARLLDDAGNR